MIKNYIPVLLVAAAFCFRGEALTAQRTMTEVIKHTTPEEDARPNSQSVPDVIPIEGEFDHIVVLRFKFKTDLLLGLQEEVQELGIRNGVILSGIGSVRDYHVHSVSNRDFPSHNIYVKDPGAPADITGMNGYVIDGRLHVHITMADSNGAFGGHLEQGTHVFTFAIITVGVFRDGIDLSRVDDKTYR